MYLSFYGLKKEPFQINADPSFLWLGEKHKEALAVLRYGIFENQGFILLTGDVGTGKTTLINALINGLSDEVVVARVPDPRMETIDFMNYISHEFGMKKKFSSKGAFLIHFGHYLNSVHVADKNVLLVIDEAQRLTNELLEEVRQLSNIEKQDTKLLNIFFVGQHEFNDVLLEDRNRALRQRIAYNYHIDRLDLRETGDFIHHRLKIAGAESEIFRSGAIKQIFASSGGFPRRINIICDHCLLSGFVLEKKTISSKMAKQCAKDLILPGSTKDISYESPAIIGTIDLKEPEEIPEEDHHKVSSGSGWKTASFGGALITIALLIFVYFKYPQDYRNFLIRVNNYKEQFFNGERSVKKLISSSHQVPVQEKVSVESFNTALEVKADSEDDKEMVVVPKPPVERDATVSVAIPSGSDQKNQSNGEINQESPAVSETAVVEKAETEADLDQEERAGTIDSQDESVFVVKYSEKKVKKIESGELPETQILSANQVKVVKAESADADVLPDFEEHANSTITVKPVNVVVKGESETALTETKMDSDQVEKIPKTKSIEQPVATLDVADLQDVQPYMVNQVIETENNETDDEKKEEEQSVSEAVEPLSSKTLVEYDNQEGDKVELKSEVQDQLSDLDDEGVKTTGVVDPVDLEVPEEVDTEIYKPEVIEVVQSEEGEVQPVTDVQVTEPAVSAVVVEPVEAVEENEETTEEFEGPDPGALIDWVIKKRSQ